jgi:membrane-associated protease RseP (regulator of RpoE activity)
MMSRRSLSLLILAATLVALAAALLLRGGASAPPPETHAPSTLSDPHPAPAGASAAPAEVPVADPAQPGPGRESPPAPLADNVKTGEEGALSPTRTAVRLYGNARVKPLYNLHNSEIGGVQISNVSPGSFWEELGIDDGDVIVELNGELINTPAASVQLMNQISRGYVLNLRLRTAEGEERFIDYRTPEPR